VRLNRARQAATIWTDADRQRAIERLEGEIYQVTPAKRMLFDKLFQHHEQQPLQKVRTKATGPRSIFHQKLAKMKTAAEEEFYWAVYVTADKRVQFQVCLSYAEIEAATWSIRDTDCVVNQLEREIYGITSIDQMQFTLEFSIHLVEFVAWWHAITVHELRKTIEQRVIHFGYHNMHLVGHISESTWRMGSGDIFTTDVSKRLHIGSVTEAYRSTNKVNYIQQMLKDNDRCTGLENMDETLSYLALQGWNDIDSAKVVNLRSTAHKQRNTRRAHLLCLHHCQKVLFFRPVSQQVHHLRETHVRGVCRSIKFASLTVASVRFAIPNFAQLFGT